MTGGINTKKFEIHPVIHPEIMERLLIVRDSWRLALDDKGYILTLTARKGVARQ
jgi:hypothetical protein